MGYNAIQPHHLIFSMWIFNEVMRLIFRRTMLLLGLFCLKIR